MSIEKRKIFKVAYLIWILWTLFVAIFLYLNRNNFFQPTKTSVIWENDFTSKSIKSEWEFFEKLIWNILEKETPKTRKKLIDNYCSSILWMWNNILYTQNLFYYDPSKSVFLYNLCKFWAIEEWKFDSFFEWISSLVKDWLYVWANNEFWFSWCRKDSDLNSCDIIWFFSKWFSAVMNDYSNAKLAALYWYADNETEEIIEIFSDHYFWESPCSNEEVYYLNKEIYEDLGNNYCSHPRTYKMLANNINEVKNLLKNAKSMDSNKLLDWDKNTNYCIDWTNYDFFRCWFQNIDWHWKWFRNILHNELMFYNLFVSYYIQNQSWNLMMSPFVVWDPGWLFKANKVQMENAQKEVYKTQKAVLHLDKMLRNIYATYPIHIWLMAYYEDLLYFRKTFAKLYTPFHQLYYKLRNVQDMRR